MPTLVAPLFVYGTLRDRDLLAPVLGRALNPLQLLPAVAPGFQAVNYPGRVYPALIRAPGAAAEGLLLLDLTAFERDLLDAFEGEEYRRASIPVIVDVELHVADAYLPTVAVKPDAAQWTLDSWQAAHKPAVLAGEAATAASIRARLIAVRPN